LKDLRQLSKSFIDNKIENTSLNELLIVECDSFNELNLCKLSFNSNASNFDLTYQTKIILLRIAQEFIQNSIKHSQCETITIAIEKINSSLRFSLQDDGKGFDANVENFNGIGLVNMKKRILLVGGNYELVSTKNGTKLTIEIAI
jgi:signal transduction histidine kinase